MDFNSAFRVICATLTMTVLIPSSISQTMCFVKNRKERAVESRRYTSVVCSQVCKQLAVLTAFMGISLNLPCTTISLFVILSCMATCLGVERNLGLCLSFLSNSFARRIAKEEFGVFVKWNDFTDTIELGGSKNSKTDVSSVDKSNDAYQLANYLHLSYFNSRKVCSLSRVVATLCGLAMSIQRLVFL
jgi:hypothetical protein